MLGYADPDGVVAIYRKPTRLHTLATSFDATLITQLPRVDIVPSYAGADGTAAEAFLLAGAEGLIISSLAPGLPTPLQMDSVDTALRAGKLVVYSTRAGSGRVLRRQSMVRAGIISADNLNPQKARVLAMLALTKTRDPEKIQKIFDTH